MVADIIGYSSILLYVAIGHGYVAVSADGISWNIKTSNTNNHT